MRRLHFEKFNKMSLVLLIVGLGIGLLITAQWKTKPNRISDPIIPYISLRKTRDKLSHDQENLKSEVKRLQNQIEKEQKRLKKYKSNQNQIEELERIRKKIGLTEIKGSGVIITMDDSPNSPATIDSVVHAADLRDLVNFLWGIGAQAISINEERITFNTSIDCIVNSILINSTKSTPPFSIKVIGEPNILIEKLNNEDNLKDIHKRVKNQGLIFSVKEEKELTIPAYNGSFVIEYAKVILYSSIFSYLQSSPTNYELNELQIYSNFISTWLN